MENEIYGILEKYVPGNKTLFFIDQSKDEKSLNVFQNSAAFAILDAKGLHVKRMVSEAKLPQYLDDARHILTFAMKYGKILVLRMGDCNPDFQNGLCDEVIHNLVKENPHPPHSPWKTFPRGFMLNNGQLVRDYADHFMRREDWREIREGDCTPLHPDFQIILSTTVPPNKLDELFFNGRYGLPGDTSDYDIILLK
jgi:hypothetical protein